MDSYVIFKTDSNSVALLVPAKQCLEKYNLKEIANKDVPAGKPYKIVKQEDLPDLDFMEAWEIDDAELTDGVGSESNEFAEQR